MSKKKPVPKSPVHKPSRKIPDLVRTVLFVRAGGRCQFDGCNEYLLEHPLTLTEGNFAQFAHVVAFSEDGPRGKDNRPYNIHDISNLMLLCPRDHKLIDDEPEKYNRATLEGYKKRHEERIYHVTGLGPDQKTSVLVLKCRIGSQTVATPYDQILEAITPRYPLTKVGLPIDLTQLSTDSDAFLKAACDTIREQLLGFLGAGGEVTRSGHISLFALAPIPVLAYLGSQLSNKIPLDVYQRHRDKDNWTWKSFGEPVQYSFEQKQKGERGSGVALVLSLSGKIDKESLPADVSSGSIYELTLAGGKVPNPTFLQTRRDLEEFKNQYHVAISTIARDHPECKEIALFPAVPAPIAVLCGRELLPKVHPALKIYDNIKSKGGFVYQLMTNN
jgi:hypothetical protein